VRTVPCQGVFQKLVIRRHALRTRCCRSSPSSHRIRVPDGWPRRHRAGVTSEIGLGKLFVGRLNQDYNMTAGARHCWWSPSSPWRTCSSMSLCLDRSTHPLTTLTRCAHGDPVPMPARNAAADHAPPRPSRWSLCGSRDPEPARGGGAVIVIVMIVMAASPKACRPPPRPITSVKCRAAERRALAGHGPVRRDLYTRIVYGARTDCWWICLGLDRGTLGLVLGVASAYFGWSLRFLPAERDGHH